jgi:hypothetical protein
MGLKDSYNTGDTSQAVLSVTNVWYAQLFLTTSAYTISSVKLKLFRDVGVTGTLTASIRATSGSNPTGGDLTSGTLDISTLGTSAPGAWHEITLTPYALSDATTYAIVLRDDTSGATYWRANFANGYASGLLRLSSNSGSSWGSYASDNADAMFETYEADATYAELSGTINATGTLEAADLELTSTVELSGTINAVGTLNSTKLGQVAVSLTESTKKRRVIAVGNGRFYYEDI